MERRQAIREHTDTAPIPWRDMEYISTLPRQGQYDNLKRGYLKQEGPR